MHVDITVNGGQKVGGEAGEVINGSVSVQLKLDAENALRPFLAATTPGHWKLEYSDGASHRVRVVRLANGILEAEILG